MLWLLPTSTTPFPAPTQGTSLDKLTWQLIPAMLGAVNYANYSCTLPPAVSFNITQGNLLIGDRKLYNAGSSGVPQNSAYGWCACSTSTCTGTSSTQCATGSSCLPPLADGTTNSKPCPDINGSLSDALAAGLGEWNKNTECG